MKRKLLLHLFCALFAIGAALALLAPCACAESGLALPGSETWQTYIDESPVSPEAFASEPLKALSALWPDGLGQTVRAAAKSYADVLLFLLLAATLSFLAAGTPNASLLDLAAAGGCSVLLWGNMTAIAQTLAEKIASWKLFLLGFLPVYAGVLTAGGETAAAASVSGLLLSALCLLAQALGAWLVPLLECYLALGVACCITAQPGLAQACALAGKLMRQGLGYAGKAFVFLLGVQRVFTLQLDSSTLRAGKLLTGTVPVIGQTLSDAAESVLAAVQMLKSSLGLAALCTLGAEFLPLYIGLLLQCALLAGCGLLCSFASIPRCKALFDCLLQAVQCMAAATALYFGIAVFGTVIMFMAGGG